MSEAFDALQKTIAEAEQTVDTAISLVDRLQAENKQLRAENERLSADGIHTCHDQCPRYACVLRRERDAALADVERLRQALRVLPFKDGNKYE